MQNIDINMYNESGEAARVSVAARVVGDLALHREANIDGTDKRPLRWRVTHVGTGAAIMSALPYVSGKPREGTAPKAAYLNWMRQVQDTPEYRNWARHMAAAPFGLIHPRDLGAKAVDASRVFVKVARNLDAPFLP